jgi:hypothetical protein
MFFASANTWKFFRSIQKEISPWKTRSLNLPGARFAGPGVVPMKRAPQGIVPAIINRSAGMAALLPSASTKGGETNA